MDGRDELQAASLALYPFFASDPRPGEALGGTGFLVRPDGHALTCAHVLENRETKEVAAWVRARVSGEPPGACAPFAVVSRDPILDVALLRAAKPGRSWPYLCLDPGADARGHCDFFGFRKPQDVDGLWGAGTVLGRTFHDGRPVWQLASAALRPGVSGAAVFLPDSAGVMGMIRYEITELLQGSSPGGRFQILGHKDEGLAVPAASLLDFLAVLDPKLAPLDAAAESPAVLVWLDDPADRAVDPALYEMVRIDPEAGEPFYVDRYAVTQTKYRRCAGDRPRPEQCRPSAEVAGDLLPCANVSWEEAGAYARRVGKSLPTVEQWRAAAHRSTWARGRCNTFEYWQCRPQEVPRRLPVTCFGQPPEDAAPADMIGNTSELALGTSGARKHCGWHFAEALRDCEEAAVLGRCRPFAVPSERIGFRTVASLAEVRHGLAEGRVFRGREKDDGG